MQVCKTDSKRWRVRAHWRLEPLESDSRYVAYDSTSDRRLRLSQEAALVARAFMRARSVKSASDQLCHEHEWISPECVLELGRELQQAGVLVEDTPDSLSLAEQSVSARTAQQRGRWLNPFFIRMDVGDPTRLLDRLPEPGSQCLSRVAITAAVLTVILLPWLLFHNVDELANYLSTDVPRAHLLAAMVCVWPVLKLLHELGHAAVLCQLGGHVRRFGVTLLFFLPLPFIDASDSWRLSSRTQRIAVSLAGIMVELALACVCLWVWQFTADGPFKIGLAAVVVVACVSGLMVNANPLMKFDGYHVLQDLLNTTSLYRDASSTLKHVMWRAFGADPRASTLTDRWKVYTLYGLSALAFRVAVVFGICLWFVRDIPMFGSGMAALLILTAVLVPACQLAAETWQRRARLFGASHQRIRAVVTAVVTVSLVLALPLPQARTRDGVIAHEHTAPITTEVAGEILWQLGEGATVSKGDVIAVLREPSLQHALTVHKSTLQRHQDQLAADVFDGNREEAQVRAKLDEAVETAQIDLAHVQHRYNGLRVRASVDGTVIRHKDGAVDGTWVSSGETIGVIVPSTEPEVHVLLEQQLAATLSKTPATVSVLPVDLSAPPIRAKALGIHSVSQIDLDDVALTRAGGGAIAVDDTLAPRIAGEAYYTSRIKLPYGSMSSTRLGQRVLVRYTLPSQPAAMQLMQVFHNTFFSFNS